VNRIGACYVYWRMRRLAFVLALAACSSKPAMTQPDPATPPPAVPAPDPAPAADSDAGSGSDAPAQGSANAGPKLGEPCGANDACGEGSCVTYYGIAGPRGPAFKSCEIKCDGGTPCAGGRKCTTIADGPGLVCR
jgi:hypothetical protein